MAERPNRVVFFSAVAFALHIAIFAVMPTAKASLRGTDLPRNWLELVPDLKEKPIEVAEKDEVEAPKPPPKIEKKHKTKPFLVKKRPANVPQPAKKTIEEPAQIAKVSDHVMTAQGKGFSSFKVVKSAGPSQSGLGSGSKHAQKGSTDTSNVETNMSPVVRRTHIKAYLKKIQRELGRPNQPNDLYEGGVVVLGLTIDKAGRIVDVRVKKSSGNRSLDEVSIRYIRQTSRVSAPPAQLGWKTREISYPIRYRRS